MALRFEWRGNLNGFSVGLRVGGYIHGRKETFLFVLCAVDTQYRVELNKPHTPQKTSLL